MRGCAHTNICYGKRRWWPNTYVYTSHTTSAHSEAEVGHVHRITTVRCYPRTKYPSLSHLSQKSLHFLLHHCFELIHTQAAHGWKGLLGRLEGSGSSPGGRWFSPQVHTRHHGHHRQEGRQGRAWRHGADTTLPGWARSSEPGSRPAFPACFFTSIVVGSAVSASPPTL